MKFWRFLWLFCFALLAVLPCAFIAQDDVANAETVYSPQNIEIENIGKLKDITIDGENVFVSDETKKMIYKFDTKNNSVSTTNTTAYGIPGKIAFNYADNLICQITNLNKIMFFDNARSEHTSFNIDGTPYVFTAIYDIAQTGDNTVFALVSGNGNNYLVKKEANSQTFEAMFILSNVSNNSKLAVNLTGSTVLMLENNQIYDLSSGTQTIQSLYNIPTLSNIASLFIDHKNDLFILDNVAGLIHCTTDENQTIAISNSADLIDFCINPFNQTIYFITNDQLMALADTSLTENSFLNTVQTTPSVNIKTDFVTSPLKTGNAKEDTYIYTYDNLMQKTTSIRKHTGVIILDEMEGNSFCYVLDTSNTQNVVGYMLKSDLAQNSSTQQSKTYKTLYVTTNVYPFPTTLKSEGEESARILTTIEKNSTLTTIESTVLPKDSNNAELALVSVKVGNENKLGFVDTRTLSLVEETEEIKTLFVANATTRNSTEIFEDNELKTLKTTLDEKTEVQIISKTQGICFVAWEDEGNLCYGYAKYENLNDGSITVAQIIGLFVMLVAIIALVITLRFVKNNKKKFDLRYEK